MDEHCALLSLPAELRNRIYAYALVQGPYIYIEVDDPTQRYYGCGQGGEQPGLTRTCRQIRNESLHLFYELNTFRFNSQFSEEIELGPTGFHVDKIKNFRFEVERHTYDITLTVNKGLTD